MMAAGRIRRVIVTGLVVLVSAVACRKAPALPKETVRSLIESSEAFQAPLDPGTFPDISLRNTSGLKREFLQLRALTLKEDGPFGTGGQTATASFTWHWSGGPLGGVTFVSKARLNSAGGPWRLYEDYLRNELAKAERGED